MTPTAPTVIDLFSGAGAFSLGFHAAGCRILAAVDVDESCGQTYRKNFDDLQGESHPTFCSATRATWRR